MLWVWLIVIVTACIFEWLTQVQLISIWAAFGGVVSLILELCGADQTVQIIVFFVVTIALIALTRPFAKKLTSFAKTPTNSDRNIGKVGKVTKVVDESMGTLRVQVENNDWAAVTEDKRILPVGINVSVKGIEGVKLIVEPLPTI